VGWFGFCVDPQQKVVEHKVSRLCFTNLIRGAKVNFYLFFIFKEIIIKTMKELNTNCLKF
jgi:hypothetical protein